MKLIQLREYVSNLKSAIVAFSGGVDSALLAKVAHDVLGERMIAATIDSASLPKDDKKGIVEFCTSHGILHRFVAGVEFQDENFLKNPEDRCYYCKKNLYESLIKLADEMNFKYVIEGTNFSDLSGHRPGMKAAEEMGHRIVQPLKALCFDKQTVRDLAKGLKLSEADKSATACLSSRIPFNSAIKISVLERVDDSEAFLKSLGIKIVRVRAHDETARIETDKDGQTIIFELKEQITKRLRSLGWRYISVDLEGYRPAVPHS